MRTAVSGREEKKERQGFERIRRNDVLIEQLPFREIGASCGRKMKRGGERKRGERGGEGT